MAESTGSDKTLGPNGNGAAAAPTSGTGASKSPVIATAPTRPPSAGVAGGNGTEKLPSNATAPTSGTSAGYKPFDYSQPLSTYSHSTGASPYTAGAGASRASPAGTPSGSINNNNNNSTSTASTNPNSNTGNTGAAPSSSSGTTTSSTSTNPIAAGFAYGATGHRTGTPQQGQGQQQQQQGAGNSTPPTSASSAAPAAAARSAPGQTVVQSRTGNNATPLTAPSIVSRTSGGPGSLPGSAAVSPLGGAGSPNNATGGAAATSSTSLGGGGPGSTAAGTAASGASAPKASSPGLAPTSNQSQTAPTRPPSAGGVSTFASRYGQNNSLSPGNLSPGAATTTRDPRTPNPVTEMLSRSPVTASQANTGVGHGINTGAAAAAAAAAASAGAQRPSSNPGEQSRTGGIATPLAPSSSAASTARPGMPASSSTSGGAASSSGKAGSPPTSANDTKRDIPGQPSSAIGGGAAAAASQHGHQHQQQPPHSASQMSWRSLLDRPYSSLYSHQHPSVSSQHNRTQSPSQRAGLWFNPLAMKQQQQQQQSSSSAGGASALSQLQQQQQQHPAGHAGSQSPVPRPASGAASGAGSPQQVARGGSGTPTSAAAGGAPTQQANTAQTTAAQNQATKRRTNSTSSAGPPYSMASVFGNRNAEVGKESASPQSRAITASPGVGSASAPTSAPATTAAATAGGVSTGNSPAYQHRPSYSMAYGDRLQQLQAKSAQERENQRQADDREMRKREQTAAAIVAGRPGGAASPPQTARTPYYGLAGGPASAAANKTSASPTLPASAGGAGSPASPQRRAAERPSSNSAFGYLFGGGGASRVATDGRSGPAPPNQFRTSSAQANQSVAQQVANYRAANAQPPITTSRTANTGLGLNSSAASPGWRAQAYGSANAAASTNANPTQAPALKQEPSPQPAPASAPATKFADAETQAGAKRKRDEAPEAVATPVQSQAAKAQTSTSQQPPPATLHAMRQREGPLFTAEDIKGAALRPPLMIVRSDNVVKALHKISSQHSALSATGQPTAPFLGRVFYDPFLDPADLLDADLLRKGVGGKVEIWLDTEWLKGETWEAGAPSHPAVSHPPSPASEEFVSDTEDESKEESESQSMQIDGENRPSVKKPASKGDLPPSWTLWDLPALRSRKIWGTDVYTDDSDILAACIHSGWLRLGSTAPLFGTSAQDDAHNAQKRRRRRKKPTLDHRSLCITIVVAPKLIKYEGSLRAGVWSRSWGNSHDGVSFAIESVQLVDNARHRLSTSRWKAFEKSQHPIVKQRCACPMGCDHSDKASVFSRSLKLGQLLGKPPVVA